MDMKLELLKQDLGKKDSGQDEYLDMLIQMAEAAIGKAGIQLTDSVEDAGLVSMYAAWLFRRRAEGTDNGMPRMLQYHIHQRLFSQKMREEENDV